MTSTSPERPTGLRRRRSQSRERSGSPSCLQIQTSWLIRSTVPTTNLYVTHQDEPPLWWRDGVVYTKDPDDATIWKMIELAGRLGARVQGDSFHVYSVRKGELVERLEGPSSGVSTVTLWRRLRGWIKGVE